MRSSLRVLAIMTLTAATSAAAQNPPGAPMPPMGGQPGAPGAMAGERSAQMLLARSAELDLTDAQVTKLAGIARRAEARHRTMRTAMDSARVKFSQPGDSIARRSFAQKMQNDMTKERDQARVDLRDAITVLTPDQQAKAWEMNAARGAARGARGGRQGGRQGGMRPGRAGGARGGMRGGRGAGMPRGGRPGRGPDGMGPGGMGPGGQMPQGNQMGPGRAPGAPGGMMPRRPRPDDGFPNERNPE